MTDLNMTVANANGLSVIKKTLEICKCVEKSNVLISRDKANIRSNDINDKKFFELLDIFIQEITEMTSVLNINRLNTVSRSNCYLFNIINVYVNCSNSIHLNNYLDKCNIDELSLHELLHVSYHRFASLLRNLFTIKYTEDFDNYDKFIDMCNILHGKLIVVRNLLSYLNDTFGLLITKKKKVKRTKRDIQREIDALKNKMIERSNDKDNDLESINTESASIASLTPLDIYKDCFSYDDDYFEMKYNIFNNIQHQQIHNNVKVLNDIFTSA